MFTFLALTVTMWGTDPNSVFAGDTTPMARSISNVERDHVMETAPAIPSLIDERSILLPNKIRGQSVCDNASPYPNYQMPPVSNPDRYVPFWESPTFKHFISAMNPFVDEEVHTLPNYYDPFGFQMGTGSFGPQGYRLGWTTYNELNLIPAAPARGTTGSMKTFEWTSYLKYSHLLAPGVLFNGTGNFNARWWDGPNGVPVPGQVDQISTDLELGFFNDGPWSGQIAFHPQIVETYEARLDRNAFNFDGRAIATYKASPEWSFVAGAAIWDRVDLMFIPHAGAIWTPNNRWEVRLLFPKSRVSYFLGKWRNADFWVYGQAEYTAESFQSLDKQTDVSDRIQTTDDRLTLGLRWDRGRYSFFTDGGYVFNRHVKFSGSNPAFDVSNSGMIRFGVRY